MGQEGYIPTCITRFIVSDDERRYQCQIEKN
jgi:hypothetical protein